MSISIFIQTYYRIVIAVLSLLLFIAFTTLAVMTGLYVNRGHNLELLQAQYAEYVAKQGELLATAQANVKTIEASYQSKLSEANQDAIIRIKQAQADADHARDAVDSLRKQTDAASRKLASASATCSTEAEYGIAAGNILQHCVAEYRKVAQVADGHANDVRTLIAAWPENR